ncbi:unnamed protein product, partial [Ilex paraguariensis]
LLIPVADFVDDDASSKPSSSASSSHHSGHEEAHSRYRNIANIPSCKVTNAVVECFKNRSSTGLYNHGSCPRTVLNRHPKEFPSGALTL